MGLSAAIMDVTKTFSAEKDAKLHHGVWGFGSTSLSFLLHSINKFIDFLLCCSWGA